MTLYFYISPPGFSFSDFVDNGVIGCYTRTLRFHTASYDSQISAESLAHEQR